MDHASLACVGLHATNPATRFEVLEPQRQEVREYLGEFRPLAGCEFSLKSVH